MNPSSQSQLSLAMITIAGDQVEILGDPFAAGRNSGGRYWLFCQVQVKCTCNIHPIRANKKTKRCADARVNIQHLKLAIAGIIPVTNIKNASISDALHKTLRGVLNLIVCNTNSQTC